MPVFRFCPRCGHELPRPSEPPGRVLRQDCPACGAVHFQNAKPAVGVLIEREGQVLLGRRGVEPFRGWWDVPGGFLEPWEHPAEAAVREVAEETGLLVRPTAVLGIYVDTYGAAPGADPDYAVDYTLNVHYLAEVVGGELRPGDDVVELRFFAADALPPDVAFANGRAALAAWRARR